MGVKIAAEEEFSNLPKPTASASDAPRRARENRKFVRTGGRGSEGSQSAKGRFGARKPSRRGKDGRPLFFAKSIF